MNDNRPFFTEERAVTPVIGIILIVAIAVILGAVVSAYALGTISDVGSPAPQTSFDFNPDYTTGDIVVTKRGGDTVTGDQLKFSGAALEKTTYGNITEWTGRGVQAGDSTTVDVVPSETLELIWRSPDGGRTAVIAEYDVPSDVGPTASIGSVYTDYYTWLRGELTVKDIQFSQVQNGRVYVVVEDEPSGGGRVTSETYFSNNGGNLPVELTPDSDVGHGETITVTVYETNDKSTELATATGEVP